MAAYELTLNTKFGAGWVSFRAKSAVSLALFPGEHQGRLFSIYDVRTAYLARILSLDGGRLEGNVTACILGQGVGGLGNGTFCASCSDHVASSAVRASVFMGTLDVGQDMRGYNGSRVTVWRFSDLLHVAALVGKVALLTLFEKVDMFVCLGGAALGEHVRGVCIDVR